MTSCIIFIMQYATEIKKKKGFTDETVGWNNMNTSTVKPLI